MQTILFFTDLTSGSRLPILRGAKERAAEADIQIQVVELARITTSIARTLAFWRPVGCLIEGSSHLDPGNEIGPGIPVVHIDANAKMLARKPRFTIMNDNAAIADLALKALLRAGCEHFAFVGWTRDVNWSTARHDAFRSLLNSFAKPCHALLDPWTLGDTADFSLRLRPWLKQLPRPCGLFAANDAIAATVLDTCRAVGLGVPEDLSVIGVDDDPSLCETAKPSLSSVRPDFLRGGYLAADLLIRLIGSPSLPDEHLVFPPAGVTLRQSTRRLPQTNPKVQAALELIRREATAGLKAADVVRHLGLSERVAEMRFKAATGRRITEEITEIRLMRVLELLRQPKQDITPIAHLCGWESDIYLKRLFKARFGMTMSAWRQRELAGGLRP